MPEDSVQVQGLDFNKLQQDAARRGYGITVDELLASMTTTGFQATSVGRAAEVIEQMLAWRSPEPTEQDARTTVFLGYTSNLISSGVRESIRFLVEHKHVSCLVTTAGGIEEDLIKCLGPTYLGAFNLDGKSLRSKGLNRIGNLLVPNDNYCKFEDWVLPVLDEMLKEQKEEQVIWTPSSMIHRLGKVINDPSSVLYWAYKNDIPVFCPALTDGSLGDMIYFHSFKNPGLIVDIASDIRKINTIAVRAKQTGMIILGGGVVKHHISNANLMRNGADYAVYINTGQEFDGSDSGARPDESISWGKLRGDAEAVKVYGDASIVFPLLVAGTFARLP
ncbi:putative deoxyhypusine synthase [Protomyces lactucae-debilis]|uniref:deoxyhypusine synthase n=1 Tax=Protomyces lactucae-debilis TaxID=2754530 RepID=A0A1Y2FUP0_PROLT|nr:putative deoxyhypusine synthase [Protomyces lactucae-debilis]ORY87721.1 putative deoxyhypusine synthase [Protomyces lactucae-debilis]